MKPTTGFALLLVLLAVSCVGPGGQHASPPAQPSPLITAPSASLFGPQSVNQFCGGIAGFPCPEGEVCIDDPRDNCDPTQGGADCGGICRQEAVCNGSWSPLDAVILCVPGYELELRGDGRCQRCGKIN